jgi:hypothetical protein
MARDTTDERARKALNDMAAENLAKAEELEAPADHAAPPLQPRSQQSTEGAPCIRLRRLT